MLAPLPLESGSRSGNMELEPKMNQEKGVFLAIPKRYYHTQQFRRDPNSGLPRTFAARFSQKTTSTNISKKVSRKSPLIKHVLFCLNGLFFENNRFNRYFSKMLTPCSGDHESLTWKCGIWSRIEPGIDTVIQCTSAWSISGYWVV